MKKVTMSAILASTLLFNSCLGSFSAFNSLRDWNDGLTDNKFLDNLVFWALNIVPVYGLFFMGDVIVFNLIEFWTGTNPIAMNEGDKETQYIVHEGNTLEMTATKNRLAIKVIDGERAGDKVDLVYNPSEKSWSAIKADGEMIQLGKMQDGFYVMNLPNGEEVQLDPMASREDNLAILQGRVAQYEECLLASAE
ncbi:DUF3332 domain-containing protein [Gangjinia marincola]|uniref:DUF3332 domain-containing protein n=1 Tax=Gangjinia marincola TaxID=578463 RepID=A0ABN1MHU6_9FLAO